MNLIDVCWLGAGNGAHGTLSAQTPSWPPRVFMRSHSRRMRRHVQGRQGMSASGGGERWATARTRGTWTSGASAAARSTPSTQTPPPVRSTADSKRVACSQSSLAESGCTHMTLSRIFCCPESASRATTAASGCRLSRAAAQAPAAPFRANSSASAARRRCRRPQNPA